MAKKKKKRRQYPEEFKRQAVRVLESRGEQTAAEIAADLGVSAGQLYQWRKELGAVQERPAGMESAEDENLRLRREISQMKKENDTLKKSIALFVREMKF
jgi:transposase